MPSQPVMNGQAERPGRAARPCCPVWLGLGREVREQDSVQGGLEVACLVPAEHITHPPHLPWCHISLQPREQAGDPRGSARRAEMGAGARRISARLLSLQQPPVGDKPEEMHCLLEQRAPHREHRSTGHCSGSSRAGDKAARAALGSAGSRRAAGQQQIGWSAISLRSAVLQRPCPLQEAQVRDPVRHPSGTSAPAGTGRTSCLDPAGCSHFQDSDTAWYHQRSGTERLQPTDG